MKISALILTSGYFPASPGEIGNVLEPIAGRPVLSYLIDAVKEADIPCCIAAEDADFFDSYEFPVCQSSDDLQSVFLSAVEAFPQKPDYLLLLRGDQPLLTSDSILNMVDLIKSEKADVLAMGPAEHCVFSVKASSLKKVTNSFFEKADRYGCSEEYEFITVNSRQAYAEAAGELRWRKNDQLMNDGVTMIDPSAVYVDYDVQIGAGTVLEPQVFIHGKTVIGANNHIGPCARIIDAVIGDGCDVGPFCYLRPGTELSNKVKAGHFVEIKKSKIGMGSKVPHLSYIGDTVIGEGVNIGCGTITCNYDGVHKHQSIIEDQAFIGSNTNLVSPVRIGARSTVAAGSTITGDVPADSLGVARGIQRNIEGWTQKKDPRFAKKEENK